MKSVSMVKLAVIIVVAVIALGAIFLVGSALLNNTTDQGVQAVQNTLQDNDIKDMTQKIATALAKYYENSQGTYPNMLSLTDTGVQLDATTNVPYTTGSAKNATFCYSRVSDGFILGGKLSDGNYYNLGTSVASKCNDAFEVN